MQHYVGLQAYVFACTPVMITRALMCVAINERVQCMPSWESGAGAKAVGAQRRAHGITLLEAIPAASLVTPHLQRFISSLSAITMPLWRTQRSTRSSTRAASLWGRGRNARRTRQRQRGVQQSLVMPHTTRSPVPRTRNILRRTIVQLHNVLTALQQVARLRMWRGQKVRLCNP
jgi:hypothetical protein